MVTFKNPSENKGAWLGAKEKYIDSKFKFDLLNQFFGISAIILNPTNENKKL